MTVLKSAQKVHKTFFYFEDVNIYNNLVLLFHFFGIWLSVKYKDFLIISNLSQVLHVFYLYKDKLKVQYKSATCQLCTNVLHFYVAIFLGRF